MKYLSLIICTFILSSFSFANPKIQPDLQHKMSEVSASDLIPVYILFYNQMKLSDFNDISYDTPKKIRREIVVNRLKNFANTQQRDVRTFLESRKNSRGVDNIEYLWINNSIAFTANAETINELTKFDNLMIICYDRPSLIEELRDVINFQPPYLNALMPAIINPGLTSLKVDLVHAQGNKGMGVLVGNADDGFHWRHPDVVKGIWQNLGEDANNNGRTITIGTGTTSAFDAGDINGIDDDGNGKIDDLIGWDFTTNNYNVTAASHGTATLSQVVGDGTMGNLTGVAPEAKSLLLRNSSGQTQQWAGFQYAVEKGADIVTSSLSWKWPSRPDYSQFRVITDMSLAAGTIHTNSTSNDGNNNGIPLNISTAGNVPAPWIHPDQLKRGGIGGVIGVGNINVNTNVIQTSSPHGPATWGNWNLWGTYNNVVLPEHKDYPYSRVSPVEVPDSMGLLKPDVSSPGEGTIACYVSSGTGYGSTFGGTSSATPHTAGVIALMLSINPEMLPSDIAKVIQMTSIDMGTPGKDGRYGAGKVNAWDATNSPKFIMEGINGGSNMLINTTLAASDTARELVGLKISTDINPQLGSLKTLKFGMTTNATGTHISSFDLYFDKDKNGSVSNGDILLQSQPFANGPITFDNLKFKFLDTARTMILVARTTGSASSGQSVNIGLTDTNQVVAYYNTKPAGNNFPFGTVTGNGQNPSTIISYALEQNYPNPFNPETVIKYSIAKDGLVKVRVYDMIGKEIATLVNNFRTAGSYSVEFDSKRYSNLSSGIYYYKIESGDFSEVKKMILLK
ncbi:MAG TPA: S8 family serine peptidase [Ignavibacteria bacterium]|nr:S8 family serine peptidase [Ignavibacteria bacterium]